MNINEIIMYTMVVFMAIGGICKCLNSSFGFKFELGYKFEEGIMSMGSLVLVMVGIISISPILATNLKPVIAPLYVAFGTDPSMFATTILSNAMGGFDLAMELAIDPEVGLLLALS